MNFTSGQADCQVGALSQLSWLPLGKHKILAKLFLFVLFLQRGRRGRTGAPRLFLRELPLSQQLLLLEELSVG